MKPISSSKLQEQLIYFIIVCMIFREKRKNCGGTHRLTYNVDLALFGMGQDFLQESGNVSLGHILPSETEYRGFESMELRLTDGDWRTTCSYSRGPIVIGAVG